MATATESLCGWSEWDIGPGTRAAVMVRPGLDFFALVFGLFKAGVVPVMIDPGIGIKSLGNCLSEAEPEVFIGIPRGSARRLLGGAEIGAAGDRRRAAGRAVGPDARPASAGRSAAIDQGRQSSAVPRGRAGRPGRDPVHQRQHGLAKGVVYTHAIFQARSSGFARSTRSSRARSISARFRCSPCSPPRWG